MVEDRDKDNVIQLLQEHGLPDSIALLSQGNDDEVDAKAQQCLTICEGNSGFLREKKDMMETDGSQKRKDEATQGINKAEEGNLKEEER